MRCLAVFVHFLCRNVAGGDIAAEEDNAVYEQLQEIEMPDSCLDNYIKDEKIQLRYKDENGIGQLLTLRRVVYYDKEKDRVLPFLTNIFAMEAQPIGQLYKLRWQIEL